MGGLLIGVLGLALPQVLGRGYAVTGDILTGRLTGVGLLLLLTYGKILAMSLSLASWQSGGIFAPILMTGAACGELSTRAKAVYNLFYTQICSILTRGMLAGRPA